jgi:uncharacterized repeat protein (TIGR01451 family)
MRNRRILILLAAMTLLPLTEVASTVGAPPAHALQPSLGTPFVVDPAVNNTVANFASTDTQGGSEPSVALDPSNAQQAVMTSFSGGWGANAPLWHTLNGGQTWTKQFSIPAPPGRPGGCPCDQTMDFGRNGTMFGTFLISGATTGNDVATGSTTNPASAASWSWQGNPAQLTNTTINVADQPWLIVNRDSTTATNDDAFVGYDEFGGGNNERVGASLNSAPPNFTVDQSPGSRLPGDGANPGLRLAKDTSAAGNGRMYAVWQTVSSGTGTSPRTVTLHLNRTANSGTSWTLNGNAGGINVGGTFSQEEYDFSFGQANTLQGGIDHAAVDPSNGDVYVVFGRDDDGATTTKNNTIYIDRLTYDGAGNLNVVAGYPKRVSTTDDTALPSVAVTGDGVVGVLYDSFDGTTGAPGNFPKFSAHLARSTDQGTTFSDTILSSFQSPTAGTGTAGRRDLGDFQQLKANGNQLFGVFSGNRKALTASASASNVIDPVFFSVPGPTADLSTTKTPSPNPVTAGTDLTYNITSKNNGTYDALNVTMSDTVPTNTTFKSISAPSGWTCTDPGVGNAGTVNCTAPSLANGAQALFTLVVHVSPSAPSGSTIDNTASTNSSTTTDPNTADNTSPTATVNVVTSADLQTTKGGPAKRPPGSNASYSIALKNNGPSDAQSVHMTDPTPSGTTFVSVAAPGGWTCTTPTPGTAGTVDCSTATVAAGATANFTLVLHINPTFPSGTTFTNTATASSTTSDSDSTNNAGKATTLVACDNTVTGKVPSTLTANGGSWCITNADIGSTLTIKPGTTAIVTNSTIHSSTTATSPADVAFCGDTLLSSLQITGATGFVLVGDTGDDACGGNSIHGTVRLLNNTAGTELSDNPQISSQVTVNGNSGTGPFPEDKTEIEGNTISSGLACSGNTPPASNGGQVNTVSSARTGECVAPF